MNTAANTAAAAAEATAEAAATAAIQPPAAEEHPDPLEAEEAAARDAAEAAARDAAEAAERRAKLTAANTAAAAAEKKNPPEWRKHLNSLHEERRDLYERCKKLKIDAKALMADDEIPNGFEVPYLRALVANYEEAVRKAAAKAAKAAERERKAAEKAAKAAEAKAKKTAARIAAENAQYGTAGFFADGTEPEEAEPTTEAEPTSAE